MQAVCDSQRRFIDVSIHHPASTSDYLAFQTSPLKAKLDEEGFLAPGLALVGDAAYVSNEYMVTPFRNATSGYPDAFNYYQSSLRIEIECAFGELVHRWGILRRPLSQTITLKKVTAMTYCLCLLHNFCVDEREAVPLVANQDAATISMEGDVPLEGSRRLPRQILGGGHHFDDVDDKDLRQEQRRNQLK